MILQDSEIARRIGTGEIGVEPGISEDQIQPASFDLRMGHVIEAINPGGWGLPGTEINADDGVLTIPGWRRTNEQASSSPPFFLGSTLDRLTLPADVMGRIAGRSTFAREGLVVHLTAGVIDPEWEGALTLEIVNFNFRDVSVEVGERVGQVIFEELKGESAGYEGDYAGAERHLRSKRSDP